ncbi:MAG: DNA gyrase subunit A, partial [Anaerolineaceae bacterium]|nr:DNA gyrase subunit A [Anaerolineaceae bacterium]
AAMRYTEASLKNFAIEMLSQIDRETVDFIDNFDSTLTEPKVLPAALPNLLLNGASGIAVGMATNVPPHNIEELLDAIVYMSSKWDCLDDITVSDLMEYIKGPDFPTGGIILQEDGKNDIRTAYATGRGRMTVRGRVHIEEMSRGRNRIIITELPYMTNKASLIERIAYLVRDGRLEGIADLRDESDRQGMRIVIELSKTANTDEVLWELYRRTPLQNTYGITLLALVNGQPRLLSLKNAIRVYLEHRIEVVRKRSEYDLKKAQQREHILIGLRVAINNLDEIIALIRGARDVDQARARLMRSYKLSEVQASAILDMPLRRIAGLERKKIEQEYKELGKIINHLEQLLSSPKRVRKVVVDELLALKETYSDRRRTQIVNLKEGESAQALLTTAKLMPAQDVWIGVMHDGRVARSLTEKLSRVSGRQAPMLILKTSTQHSLYLVSEDGRAVSIVMDSIPESEQLFEGTMLSKISPFRDADLISTTFSIPLKKEEIFDKYFVTVSRFGLVKKSSISGLPGPSSQPFLVAKVNPDDALIKVILTDGSSDLCLM